MGWDSYSVSLRKYGYSDSNFKLQTVWQWSHVYDENPNTNKMVSSSQMEALGKVTSLQVDEVIHSWIPPQRASSTESVPMSWRHHCQCVPWAIPQPMPPPLASHFLFFRCHPTPSHRDSVSHDCWTNNLKTTQRFSRQNNPHELQHNIKVKWI